MVAAACRRTTSSGSLTLRKSESRPFAGTNSASTLSLNASASLQVIRSDSRANDFAAESVTSIISLCFFRSPIQISIPVPAVSFGACSPYRPSVNNCMFSSVTSRVPAEPVNPLSHLKLVLSDVKKLSMQASVIASRRATTRAPRCSSGRSIIDLGARIYSNVYCFDVSRPTLTND